MKKSILIITLGLIWVLGFAPFNLWVFPLFSLAGFFYLISKELQDNLIVKPKRRAFFQGWLYGIGMFAGGVHWIYISIAEFGKGGPIAGVFVAIIFISFLALYPAIFAILYAILGKNIQNKIAAILIFSTLWILIEWLRGWLFTGFPWLLLGNAFVDVPISSFVPVFGVYAVGFAAIFIACGLVYVIQERNKSLSSKGVLLAIITIIATSFALKKIEWTENSGYPLKVAVVQGNIKQDIKWKPEFRQYTLDKYYDLTKDLFGKVDVVVWPETAIPDFLHYVDEYMLNLQEEANAANTSIVTGVPVYDHKNKRYFNAMIAIDKQGVSYYAKRHLVIFGEYLPFRSVFGESLDFLGAAMADFTSGNLRQQPLKTKKHNAAVSICFEIVFGDEIARELGEADYMINISNDAWFEGSIAPYQHLQIARMRSLETGRPLVRSTNTGISATVDHKGNILVDSPQFAEYILTGTIQPRKGKTPYVRWGNIPVISLMVLLLMIGVFINRRGIKQNG